MQIAKAVITAASRAQRALPLQRLVDRDRTPKSVLQILVEEALQAGVDQVGVVVCPGDQRAYAEAAGDLARRIEFIEQPEARGYGDAVLVARGFVGDAPFLHLVGDHLFLSQQASGCAADVVQLASEEACAVSAVQPTRESLLPSYGAVGGRRLPGPRDQYLVEQVLEKPTPTEAEQRLIVPGLRAGHYLCFFGIHVLTPAIFGILADQAGTQRTLQLSAALHELAQRERYVALVSAGRRYDLGARYGVLMAQMALALSGVDREEVLAQMVELLATRHER